MVIGHPSGTRARDRKDRPVNREIIRVEPFSTYLESWKALASAITCAGHTIYASGFRPSALRPARWLMPQSSAKPSL